MIAAWVAITAVPGTSGFFSKDEILTGVYDSGRYAIWIVLLLATAGTGFYMSRLIFLTFFGRSRVDAKVHAHEAPVAMIFPLVVLAAGALLGGLLGSGGAEHGRLQRFLEPAVAQATEPGQSQFGTSKPVPRTGGLSEIGLGAIAFGASAVGMAAAGFLYLGGRDWQRRRQEGLRPVIRGAARSGFGFDAAYQFVFTSAGRLGAAALAAFDRTVIDGAVNWVGRIITMLSAGTRKLQTGYVRSYAVGLLGGAVFIGAYLLVRVR
jgi:NADH-quinone oxidoreductase subunit L